MAKKYRDYDPEQTLLLSPNLKDWLPDDHLAVFIDEVVDELDLSPIFEYYEVEERGGPPFHPAMMTKVLFYAYCIGMPSSRKIDKSMYEDVAFRYLGAGNFPDFRTISDFRKIHLDVLGDLFVQVLKLCGEAGLVELGTVALDGTKVSANASMEKTKKYETLCKKEEELEKAVKEMLEKAEKTDKREDEIYGKDKRGDELPEGFREKEERLERIREAKRRLEEEQKEKREDYEEKMEERKEQEEKTSKKIRGRKPKEVPEEPEEDAKANTTDPDSRTMKTRKGFVQGYNGQIVVDCDSQVIIAEDIVQDHNDKQQQYPMMKKVHENTGRSPKNATMDAGYWDEESLKDISLYTELYVATEKDWKERKKMREKSPPKGRIPKDATYKERMERKLRTKKGKETYKKRSTSVEPVIGQIKNRGLGKLLLRGLEKVKGEWTLINLSHNLRKLWKARTSA
ncbi:MAG: IS1182 family transposase [Thermoplasmata archaeon]